MQLNVGKCLGMSPAVSKCYIPGIHVDGSRTRILLDCNYHLLLEILRIGSVNSSILLKDQVNSKLSYNGLYTCDDTTAQPEC